MRAVAWFLLLLFCSVIEGAEGPRCGLMCKTEVQYSGLTWRQGVGMSLSFPLELYQPEQGVFWRQQTESTLPVSRLQTLPQDEQGWRLRRARPELRWKGDWGSGAVRLNGHRVRVRLQSPDKTQRLQFFWQPESVGLELQWRY